MCDPNLWEKSMPCVFVGNIPYEAAEENMKDIFKKVGPVSSFRLVYDRETGKPKGYGFCEYKDEETALSAIRNLNGYEVYGRKLCVDNACTEKSRLEMESLMQRPPVKSQYGEPVSPEKAPEAISKVVASLPPEQKFELMREMKLCVQNNPTEARQMLLQNPQLAYALLQAQVEMHIVDPQIARTMLQKDTPVLQPLMPVERVRPPAPPVPVFPPQVARPAQPDYAPPVSLSMSMSQCDGTQWNRWRTQLRGHKRTGPGVRSGNMDMRALDPRILRGMGHQYLRMRPQNFSPAEHFPRDPRGTAIPNRFQRDPRAGGMNRSAMPMAPVGVPRPVVPLQPVAPPSAQGPQLALNLNTNVGSGASHQEKAALLMQVLQLSDDQIAVLPQEQRQIILLLKDQIAKSTQR